MLRRWRLWSVKNGKSAESKAHKRPTLPSAWHFALYRLAERKSQVYPNLPGSGNTSAPPPENQRDHEQHKEYEKQKFRDAG
jgi:hypothetical protein